MTNQPNTTHATGVVFAFDGPDGVGKTTQLKLAGEALKAQGYSVEVRRIMGGTPIGEALRTVIFNDSFKRPIETDMHIVLAIYHALAAETNKLRQNGKIVLIDRSPLSILAYQAYGGGLSLERGHQVCDEALQLFRPDMIVVYQADDNMLSQRRHARHPDENDNYFENQQRAFHKRVIEGYEAAVKRYGATNIAADGLIDEIHQKTMSIISNKLNELSILPA